ncbi:glucosyltransferase domain-containing protein [Flavobacterium sp. NRK F10]|uniref:Glycosyltransferase RgtA/B/C/D-like domain-containing protein n=1 Tax=Flavobacterium sediminis TaxID=2201181 RepID=A0A2U8QUV8_9FLAO|nr:MULTISPECIES: glucosyltransferase domain-containing protein [Flavobacterium]AWM13666.1 hypothetical protein DI487_07180 [Flavobacterium sediminis]MCO6174789.1 glucosyltransferase domain-containing protein [Flavobacterium sp. NRK F10]
MSLKIKKKNISLFVFSLLYAVLCYGFALTNFTLTIDNEQVFPKDHSLGMGRWGTNLIRCRIFDGITPYYTLLLSLFFLAFTAVALSRLFNFKNIYSYLFCALFLSFPQMAYQMVFTMQADAVAIGFFASSLSIILFLWALDHLKIESIKSYLALLLSAILIVFVIAIYQALVFLPVVIFTISLFQNTFKEDYSFKKDLVRVGFFTILMFISGILYYISVKLFCPPMGDIGHLDSYTSSNQSSFYNRFIDFYNLLVDNFRGDFYYGDKPFLFASLISLVLIGVYIYQKKHFFIRFTLILASFVLTFFISFFITNGAHPPRLYVATNIIFAFIIIHFFSSFKYKTVGILFASIISLANIYLITLLFLSSYKICQHDQQIARKIDAFIYTKYPTFNYNTDYVYFYGSLPASEHNRFVLPKSEIFGGSFFSWDGGSNNRIINFIKFYDIAYYREIDNKETFLKIADSIESIPIWPNPESIKKIDNVVIVRLGKEKGSKLSVE